MRAFTAWFAKALTTLISSPHEFQTFSSYLDHDEEVDYGSDTTVHGEQRTMSNQPVPEVRPYSDLNRFVNVIKPTRWGRSIMKQMPS